MIRMSASKRRARGRAAETAARPPTLTKSSISVVTNRTRKIRPQTKARRTLDQLLCKNGSNCLDDDAAAGRTVSGRKASLPEPRNLGSRRAGQRGGPGRLRGSVSPMTITNKDDGNLTGSFDGVRVLDFSTTIAGPHCTRMLADMGAEVIKVETAEGETMRTRPPLRNHCSTTFGQLNVGKHSFVLDLKSEQGVEAVRRLVASADVLVENFRPGVMRRLKLDYACLRELNPKLVYCSI